MPIGFYYFDLGNVLVTFSHDRMCRQMAEASGVEVERVRQALFDAGGGASLQCRFERGDLEPGAVYEEFCRHVGAWPDQQLLFAAASDIFAPIPENVALAARLAGAGNRLGVLSNTNPVDWRHVTSSFSFLRDSFEGAALSFEAGRMKPDRAMYEYAVRRAGVPAHEVFFVDDRPENVAGALAAGLDAVLYTDSNQLRADLRARATPGVDLGC